MKQNQKNRFSGRYPSGTRSNKQLILRNTALESSGPAGKLRGTALQLVDKYQAAAKDALLQNDRVLSETFLQYADHYIRMQNIALANEQALRPVPHIPDITEDEENIPDMSEDTTEGEQIAPPAATADPVPQNPVRPIRRGRRPAAVPSADVPENSTDITEIQ